MPAPLYHVDNNQADNQRDGTDNLEVQQGNRPVRPTAFMLSMPAIPVTTVQKMTGAMIILMSLTNASPSGFICAPSSG